MNKSIIRIIAALLFTMTVFNQGAPLIMNAAASNAGVLRRKVSPEQPMWIVHIDTWNNADPEKIIDLIPEDILPYVVFNISLDPGWNEEEQRFERVEYGYETAKSWLRICSERRVWAMIQPAAGGPSHFPDYDPLETDYENTIYGEFFRDYPCFIGFNYCEQFWGFDNYVEGFPITAEERYIHLAGLLKLCNKYGGYLIDSWCGNEWAASINPIAMLSRVPQFEEAARKYSDNFILLEKFTSISYLYDTESLVLGAYLSGYCGNYGIRYDSSGWTGGDGSADGHYTTDYTLSTGLSVHLERMILNGATVIDGPELIWVDDFQETEPTINKKGYSVRNWKATSQFNNVFVDMYRKILSGAFRIPSREEVIKRTKYILVNDLETGTDDEKYSIPENLFDGLYKMDGDGNLKDNHSFYKSTGRYPTIPITAGFANQRYSDLFEHIILKSEYKSTWQDESSKVSELNEAFEQEYTGDLYAAHFENTWITYNPYKKEQTAKAVIPFKYNTAQSIGLEFNRYTTGFYSEYSDHIDVYLNNYNDRTASVLKTDVITINGSESKPTVKFKDRGSNIAKAVFTESWSNGVYTLSISHNGPVDITIFCSGGGKDRSFEYTPAVLTEPEAPTVYYGTLQHEAELFDTSKVENVIKNGVDGRVRNYFGQGYLLMGMNKGAKATETFKIEQAGLYTLNLRYRSGGGTVDVYINGKKNNTELSDTNGQWDIIPITAKLKKGQNIFEIRMNDELESKLYIDCFTIDLISAGSDSKAPIIVSAALVIVGIAAVSGIILKLKSAKN